MEIGRDTLIKFLSAMVDTLEVVQRELMLHQMLFAGACKEKGLSEAQIQMAVNASRRVLSPKIAEGCQASYQSLLEKLPQIVDLLDSNRDEALRLLKEWTPKGPVN